jgi:methyltransferase (TIGR00027 family)
MQEPLIQNVSDTAHWVAIYRVWETSRKDALFRDPLAAKLVGEHATEIHRQMSHARYVYWSVVVRTAIIDSYLTELIASEGIDTVINLGSGLDTRPYRMTLPPNLKWIEVDFPQIIDYKSKRLADDKPNCQLERIAMDLSDPIARRELFTRLNAESRKAVILTEGVTPYLSNDDVAALADAIRDQPNFAYWITDYNSPELVKMLNNPRRKREMKNAPFLFNPPDWFEFYKEHGWKPRELRYIGDESGRLGRPMPLPWIFKLLSPLFKLSKRAQASKRMNGYAIMERI